MTKYTIYMSIYFSKSLLSTSLQEIYKKIIPRFEQFQPFFLLTLGEDWLRYRIIRTLGGLELIKRTPLFFSSPHIMKKF